MASGFSEIEQQPLVSVMIPCYNTGEALKETLDSIINQTYRNWEIVAVDDASSDNTGAILDEYAKRHKGKIVVVHNAYDNGIKHNSFNVGWEHTRGDWVIDLGHDDLLDCNFLSSALSKITSPDIDAVVPRVVLFADSEHLPKPSSGGLKGKLDAVISGREAVMLSLDWQITSFCLWRGIIARASHIDEQDTPYDWGELESRRRFMACRNVAFCEGEYRYRFNQTSITHKAWGRNSHRRLVTNREVLSDLIRERFPEQVIDAYRIASYRALCGFWSRFFVSGLYWRNSKDRKDVRMELKAFYNDNQFLDRKRLLWLCPTFLDYLRLHFWFLIVPISFWRKLLNRMLGCSSIF